MLTISKVNGYKAYKTVHCYPQKHKKEIL